MAFVLAPRENLVHRTARVAGVALLALALIGARPTRSEPRGDDEDDTKSDAKTETDEATKPEGAPAKAGSALGNWNFRTNVETSFYADSDHVSVVSPTAGFGVDNPITGWSVGGSYLVDVVSAASADIVATATPRWREIRHAAGVSLGYKPGNFGASLSGSASVEPDYLSMTGGGTLTWDLFEKNVTAMLGYGYGHDVAGLHEIAFDKPYQLDRHQINGGASWTVDRATLATLVGDVVLEQGEQSKLYRHVPMFLSSVVEKVPVGATVDLVNQLRADPRPREKLPQNRERFALTGRIAHRFTSSTIRAEERLYIDSWSLFASTTDLRVMWDIGDRFSFGPRGRFHVQTGADFWQRAYSIGSDKDKPKLPSIFTGDRELGPLYTVSGGLAANIDLSGSPGDASRVLSLVVDGMYTAYEDALYITDRSAVFGALTFNATFE